MNETETIMSTTAVHNASKAGDWFNEVRLYALDYHVWLTEVAVLGGISFIVGFLLKNFGKYIVSAALIALLTILGLQYMGVVTLSIGEIATTLGLPEAHTVPELVQEVIAWARVHVFGALSIGIGFILGWMIG